MYVCWWDILIHTDRVCPRGTDEREKNTACKISRLRGVIELVKNVATKLIINYSNFFCDSPSSPIPSAVVSDWLRLMMWRQSEALFFARLCVHTKKTALCLFVFSLTAHFFRSFFFDTRTCDCLCNAFFGHNNWLFCV